MDEVSSRSEHRFACQRARFKGSNVVVEHVHDAIDELLGETHTPMVDCSGNWVEVDGFRWPLSHPNERFGPSDKPTSWLRLLTILKSHPALGLLTKADHLACREGDGFSG